MVREEPVFELLEEGNILHDGVHEQNGESEDAGGGGLHIEAREHETQSHDRNGLDGEHEVGGDIMLQARGGLEDGKDFVGDEGEETAPRKPDSRKNHPENTQRKNEHHREKRAGQPFDDQQSKAGNGAGQDHPQRAVLGLLGHEVSANESGVKWQQEIRQGEKQPGGDGEGADVILHQIPVSLEGSAHLRGGAGEFEEDDEDVLRQQKHDEADVGPFLAKQLPKFVFQLVIEHEFLTAAFSRRHAVGKIFQPQIDTD